MEERLRKTRTPAGFVDPSTLNKLLSALPLTARGRRISINICGVDFAAVAAQSSLSARTTSITDLILNAVALNAILDVACLEPKAVVVFSSNTLAFFPPIALAVGALTSSVGGSDHRISAAWCHGGVAEGCR